MGRQNIIPEHEQQEMGFVLDSVPPPTPLQREGQQKQQDEG